MAKIGGYISTSNYYDLSKTNENLTLIGGNLSLNDKTTLSLGVGNDCKTNSDGTTNKLAVEAKAKYNISDKLNIQARFREIGGSEQYRLTFGGSHPLGKNNSVYCAIHGTTKKKNGSWSTNTGGWVGLSHKFKNGMSLSAEVQQNIPLNNAKKSFGETIRSFDDDNKMVSVFLTIPVLKK